jgi:glutathione S-transferase
MLKVLGRANSFNVRKVMWCLAEIGVPAAREDYGRDYAAVDTPEFKALNPNSRVPVLIDGDLVLWESNTIVRYLCARYGEKSLLGADPASRAGIEMWMDWQLANIPGPQRVVMDAQLIAPGSVEPAALKTAFARYHALMTILDAALAGPYLKGATLTAADFVLGPVVHRWFALDIPRPDLARVTRYRDALAERPAYRDHVAIGSP